MCMHLASAHRPALSSLQGTGQQVHPRTLAVNPNGQPQQPGFGYHLRPTTLNPNRLDITTPQPASNELHTSNEPSHL